MEAGDGATGSEGNSGAAGYIEITSGSSGIGRNGGYVRILAGQGDVNGGDANITAGVGINGTGGNVNIVGGTSGLGAGSCGNVNIWAGVSLPAPWTFDEDGFLTLPGEGYIRAISDAISVKSYDLANSLGYGLRVGTTGGLYLEQGSNPAYLTFDSNAGNAQIYAASGQSGAAGKNLTIYAGSADEFSYNTSTGGNIYLQAGAGGSNDGGGGGQGGWVNITSGSSNDPAGVPGNVTINTGNANTWNFDYTGNLIAPGSIVTSSGQGGNISGDNVITSNIVVTTPVPLANLTAIAGGRAFINDGNLVSVGGGSFGAQVGGGGANICPVWSDGTNWYIG